MLSIGESIPDGSRRLRKRYSTTPGSSVTREWLGQLNDKQRMVIERRYGLNGCDICTLEDLAESLSLTRERAARSRSRRAGRFASSAAPPRCDSEYLL